MNQLKLMNIAGLFMLVFMLGAEAFGQILGSDLNKINTAVPFITIAPDSRSSAMGDVGIASKPDINSQHWNVAKYAFMKEEGGLSVSYTPWERNLISGLYLIHLSSYYKLTPDHVISGSLRYFSLGQITYTNNIGTISGKFRPFELALDAGYSILFSDNFSGGIICRYIHSDRTRGQIVNGQETKPWTAVGADLEFYYENVLRLSENDAGYAWGITLSNLGAPITYTDGSRKARLPSNIGIGGRFDYGLNDNNEISIMLDLNKLLVPTRPIRDPETDSVLRGYPEPKSIAMGMIQSFYDAPGINYNDGTYSSVFREELAEVLLSVGAEYLLRQQFAIRTGYLHEAAIKGNRKHVTLGVGFKLKNFFIDFSYLFPTNGKDSPFANTIRFSLGLNLSKKTD
jgi:hypothetical protein